MSRTPYNFNYWDVELGAPRDMTTELEAVKHGFAYVEMNERGRYFSEGDYDILGTPLTDSDDALDWMGGLPWSADKVGLIGCSSTAEWQLSVASRGNKALGDVCPGKLRRGRGARGPVLRAGQLVPRWRGANAVCALALRLRASTNDGKPNFPPGMSQEALVAAAKSYDLSAHPPTVDWSKALWHLPEKDILAAVGQPARHLRR